MDRALQWGAIKIVAKPHQTELKLRRKERLEMTTTHRLTSIFAIATFTLCVCRALDLRDNVVCSSARPLLNNLIITQTIADKTNNIAVSKWKLNDTESQYLPKVCRAVAIYALGTNSAVDQHDLGDSTAGQLVRMACDWLYYNSTDPAEMIPQCKKELYSFCFGTLLTENWRRFKNNFTSVFCVN